MLLFVILGNRLTKSSELIWYIPQFTYLIVFSSGSQSFSSIILITWSPRLFNRILPHPVGSSNSVINNLFILPVPNNSSNVYVVINGTSPDKIIVGVFGCDFKYNFITCAKSSGTSNFCSP